MTFSKLTITFLLASCFTLCTQAQSVTKNNLSQLALTPPMGCNSYNCFGSAVHEDEVKANADYRTKNLKQYGWQYVVVDFYGRTIIPKQQDWQCLSKQTFNKHGSVLLRLQVQ